MSEPGAIAAAAVAEIMATEAGAGEIDLSRQNFDDRFQTVTGEVSSVGAVSLSHSIQFEGVRIDDRSTITARRSNARSISILRH